jgi:hypothetical protein
MKCSEERERDTHLPDEPFCLMPTAQPIHLLLCQTSDTVLSCVCLTDHADTGCGHVVWLSEGSLSTLSGQFIR